MEFEKSETKKNLETALQGEALAHLKYQWYKSKLSDFNKKYENVFDEIIHNEKEHGKIWFKLLNNGEMPNNEMNLVDAIDGESFECHKLYNKFGKIAKEEGFEDISKLFYEVALIECGHSEIFKEIKEEIKSDSIFKSSKKTSQWKCLNCGYIHEDYNAPMECPVCKHPQKYFEQY